MGVSPVELLNLSNHFRSYAEDENLAENVREVFLRECISVAYYGCYHLALELATSRGYKRPQGWGSHEALWVAWYTSDLETQELGVAGKSLHSLRCDASYRLQQTLHLNVEGAMGMRDDILELLKSEMERVSNLPPELTERDWNRKDYAKQTVVA